MTDCERPSQHRPAHHPAVESGNRAVLVFVTVCTRNRQAVLANPHMHAALRHAWTTARDWWVGRYVVMPDHVHFLCAPGRCDYPALSKWMAYWKSLVVRMEKGFGPLAGGMAPSPSDAGGPGGTGPSRGMANGPGGTGPSTGFGGTASTPSLLAWQRDYWDRQLRNGESYGEKWAYVRTNPVRAGLVERPEDWLYQGEMNELRWHDR